MGSLDQWVTVSVNYVEVAAERRWLSKLNGFVGVSIAVDMVNEPMRASETKCWGSRPANKR